MDDTSVWIIKHVRWQPNGYYWKLWMIYYFIFCTINIFVNLYQYNVKNVPFYTSETGQKLSVQFQISQQNGLLTFLYQNQVFTPTPYRGNWRFSFPNFDLSRNTLISRLTTCSDNTVALDSRSSSLSSLSCIFSILSFIVSFFKVIGQWSRSQGLIFTLWTLESTSFNGFWSNLVHT